MVVQRVKTADRKVMQVRVLSPPPLFQTNTQVQSAKYSIAPGIAAILLHQGLHKSSSRIQYTQAKRRCYAQRAALKTQHKSCA